MDVAGMGPVTDKGLKYILKCKAINLCAQLVAAAGKGDSHSEKKVIPHAESCLKKSCLQIPRSFLLVCAFKLRAEKSLKRICVGEKVGRAVSRVLSKSPLNMHQ